MDKDKLTTSGSEDDVLAGSEDDVLDDSVITQELGELRQNINSLNESEQKNIKKPQRGGRRRGSRYAKKKITKRANPAKRTKRNRNKKSNRRRASRHAY
jgi:hypothetical protein